VDNAWEQEKLKARKMLENAAESQRPMRQRWLPTFLQWS
jgi:hypothetical protein